MEWLKHWLNMRLKWMDEQLGFDPNFILYGDVNCDNVVNVTDVSVLLDYILNNSSALIDLKAADCNHDGMISVSDMSFILDYLMNGVWP